ncbi:MAG: carbon storage regulator [Pirellulales bacterium]|nr:carbon storage regulator [Pirellulales bacterium]
MAGGPRANHRVRNPRKNRAAEIRHFVGFLFKSCSGSKAAADDAREIGTPFVNPKGKIVPFVYHVFREVGIMLVLSRKEGEQLLIGDNIVLTINRISGNRVAIGIDAPRDVRVVRGELQRHESVSCGSASMAIEETNIAIASKPH